MKRPGPVKRRASARLRETAWDLWPRPVFYHGFVKYSSGYMEQNSERIPRSWDFLTNHAHVLVCVARDPGIRLRDVATAIGITERAAHRIVSELVDEGYVLRERRGRRNHYQVNAALPLRHPLTAEREVGDLLRLLLKNEWPVSPDDS